MCSEGTERSRLFLSSPPPPPPPPRPFPSDGHMSCVWFWGGLRPCGGAAGSNGEARGLEQGSSIYDGRDAAATGHSISAQVTIGTGPGTGARDRERRRAKQGSGAPGQGEKGGLEEASDDFPYVCVSRGGGQVCLRECVCGAQRKAAPPPWPLPFIPSSPLGLSSQDGVVMGRREGWVCRAWVVGPVHSSVKAPVWTTVAWVHPSLGPWLTACIVVFLAWHTHTHPHQHPPTPSTPHRPSSSAPAGTSTTSLEEEAGA
jgi:hypothetical protein